MSKKPAKMFKFVDATADDFISTEDSTYYQMTYYHKTLRDSKGDPVKARRNGKVKTWKTRPNEFRAPMKYGLYEYFYITHENVHNWARTCELVNWEDHI